MSRSFFDRFARRRQSSSHRRAASTRRAEAATRRRRLFTESLEERLNLALAVWDGGGADDNWTTAANWAGDVAPVANDDLAFPIGAARLNNVNDYAANTSFGAILVSGSNYNLSGNAVTLNGALTSSGSNNTVGFGLKLTGSYSLANNSFSTLTFSGPIDLNGYTLNVANPSSGPVVLNGAISGNGGVSVSGGTTTLGAANSYTGVTSVTNGTLIVKTATSLGTADGTAGTGTTVSNGSVQLENSITVANELLTGTGNTQLYSSGDNTWTGDINSNSYLTLSAITSLSRLQVDGDISNLSEMYVNGSGGRVVLNGTNVSAYYAYFQSGVTEVNGSLSTNYYYVYSYGGATITGNGAVEASTVPGYDYPWYITSGATVNPGSIGGAGDLDSRDINFQTNSNYNVDLLGTAPGTAYDQLLVNGAVSLAGKLNVNLGFTPAIGNTFQIITNDSNDAVSGTFAGLAENSLLVVGSTVFRVSYVGGTGNDVVLTVINANVWDGGGTDDSWQTAANWLGDVAPTPGADLIFPTGAARLSNNNNFPANTSFGTVLVTGSGYTFAGNTIDLDDPILVNATNTTLNFDIRLLPGGAITNNSFGTLTVNSAIDLNGNSLSVANPLNASTLLNDTISGNGGLTITSGTTTLGAANSYTGVTSVTNGAIIVKTATSLGTADGTAGTGTTVSNGSVQLENSITVANELLTGTGNTQLYSSGDNTWTGDINSNSYLTLSAITSLSRLQVDGDISNLSEMYVNGSGGRVVLNGTNVSAYYAYFQSGVTEVNGSLSTNYYYVYSYGGATITGNGAVEASTVPGYDYPWYITSGATVNPGSIGGAGDLDSRDINFQTNSNYNVDLLGTAPGTAYDQLLVNGAVSLAGKLNVNLGFTPAIGNTFQIITNDSNDAVSGTFAGLAENSLLVVGSTVFRVSYVGGTGNDVVLTVINANVWDGGGTDDSWQTAANWLGDVAPTPGADLIFPTGAARLSNNNNFPANTSFGTVLVTGSGYTFAGNTIDLDDPILVNATNTTLNFDIRLLPGGAITNNSFGTLTVNSAIDLNGNSLSVANPLNASTLLNDTISGNGGLTITSGTTTLGAANSYTGVTSVTNGAIIVKTATSLGTADGTAGTGTTVSNGSVQLENSITVANELLTGTGNTQLYSSGDNTWTGDINSNSYLTLSAITSLSRLQVDGDISNLSEMYVNGSGGRVVLNGTNVSAYYAYFQSGVTEVNGSLSTNYYYVYSYGGATITGNGAVEASTVPGYNYPWYITSGATVNPGSIGGAGDLDSRNINFQSNSNYNVDLLGTAPGTAYDQLLVNGAVSLAGKLNLNLGSFTPSIGSTYVIIANDGVDAVTGSFQGLPEGSLFEDDSQIWRISYVGGDGNDVVVKALTGDPPIIDGTNGDDLFEARLVGSDFEVLMNSVVVLNVPLLYIAPYGLTINGLGGNDTLLVNYQDNLVTDGFFSVPITFNGGTQSGPPGDKLTVLGGDFNTVTFNYDSADSNPLAHSGTIDQDGTILTYTGLEPISYLVDVDHYVFNLPGTDDQSILEDDAGTLAGVATLRSAGNQYETTSFSLPNVSASWYLGNLDDRFTVAASFGVETTAAAYTVYGQDGDDSILVDTAVDASFTLLGANGNDTLQGGDGGDNVQGGADDDLLLIQGDDAVNDVLLGGAGNDELRNVGASDVTLGGFNASTTDWSNSIELYSGNGYGIVGASGSNELHFGFTRIESTTSIGGGDGDDDVTTSHDNVSEVAYDGGAHSTGDHITLVFTPDQLGAMVTADILAVKSYVADPTAGPLTVTAADALGNFTAANFESASVAVYDDDLIIDITACFAAIVSDVQIVVGTTGADTLTGTALADLIFGQDGNDVISGLGGADCLFGGRDADSLSGGIDADLLLGGSGDDTLSGDQANDTLYGGSGGDTLYGGADEDWLYGGVGADSLYGQLGHDRLWGEANDDYLSGGDDNDTLDGGAGVDSVYGDAGVDKLQVKGTEAENDVLIGGAQFDDLEVIGGAAASINGFSLAGNQIERILGNGQGLNGNSSPNIFNLSGVTFTTLSPLAFVNGLGGDDQLVGSEFNDVLIGGDDNDVIQGNGGADMLVGGDGDDSISGGNGNDTIDGGAGADNLSGDGGNDLFYVRGAEMLDDVGPAPGGRVSGGANTDRIVNVGGSDLVLRGFNGVAQGIEYIEGAGFGIVGTSDPNSFDFRTSATASDIYSSSTVVFIAVAYVNGLGGADVIYGTNGNDVLLGDAGADQLYGMHGDDTLLGGADNDTLNGGSGIDSLNGGDGVDSLTGGAGNDYFVFVGDVANEDLVVDFSYDFLNVSAYGITYANVAFAPVVGGGQVTLNPSGKKVKLQGVVTAPAITRYVF
ncbi:MAG: hypothetical protein U0939_05560 [Pirellulales bacterium]